MPFIPYTRRASNLVQLFDHLPEARLFAGACLIERTVTPVSTSFALGQLAYLSQHGPSSLVTLPDYTEALKGYLAEQAAMGSAVAALIHATRRGA